jgi:hypothetical protein
MAFAIRYLSRPPNRCEWIGRGAISFDHEQMNLRLEPLRAAALQYIQGTQLRARDSWRKGCEAMTRTNLAGA